MTNCFNCGAPISGNSCAHCGTPFYDFSVLDLAKPCWVTIKYGNSLLKARMYVESLSATVEQEPYLDLNYVDKSGVYRFIRADPVLKLDLSMMSVGDFTIVEREE